MIGNDNNNLTQSKAKVIIVAWNGLEDPSPYSCCYNPSHNLSNHIDPLIVLWIHQAYLTQLFPVPEILFSQISTS